SARAKSLAVELEVASDVPQRVVGDAERLRQMLIDLLSGAVSSTREGWIALRVHREAGALLRFEVEDTGTGRSGETRERGAGPSTRADGTLPRRGAGSGLGLEVVRLLSARMSGSTGVDREPGQGNRFWFTASLPVAAEEDGAKPGAPDSTDEEHLPTNTRLLLAEDDPVNQKLTAYTLQKFGYQVDVVANGAEAVAALEKVPYDLVFMDCQMPEMDGYRATEMIRASEGSERHTVIVALTANAGAGDRERCLDCGMDDYVAKPFRPSDLRRVLRHWLKSPADRAA
ncbi:MAG: response regulator, partial [Candidatus Eisenbacteria bacterium]